MARHDPPGYHAPSMSAGIPRIVSSDFFDRDPQLVARDLLGKIIRVRQGGEWLAAKIIETEAYYLVDKASHASLGFTDKRKALFMPAGTIYMYYAHGGDSLNFSCAGKGNAVLIKSGLPFPAGSTLHDLIEKMQTLNPLPGGRQRQDHRLCSGQTLLCRSLGLKVEDWDQRQLDPTRFYLADYGINVESIVQTTRLGIPAGRDEHLPYRFLDLQHLNSVTKNPISERSASAGKTYEILEST